LEFGAKFSMEDTGVLSIPPPPPKAMRKKKEPFGSDEDAKLRELVAALGPGSWAAISVQIPGRSPRQCRERWKLYLSPDVTNDPWSLEDEQRLVKMYFTVGPRWTLIAKAFPDRTANNVKNKTKQSLRHLQKLYRTGEQRPIYFPPVGDAAQAVPEAAAAASTPIPNSPHPRA
jgi:hypothetical protein